MFCPPGKISFILFQGDKYIVHIPGNGGLLREQNIGPNGKTGDGKPSYYGWCGLRRYDSIDAMVRVFEDDIRTYIFQDDLIYLWDSKNQTCGGKYPEGAVAQGWPKKIKDVFPIPKKLWSRKVDTVFQNYLTKKVVFFYGKYFYAFEWNNVARLWKTKGPKKIMEYYRNICDIKMCAEYVPKGHHCRSWDLTKKQARMEMDLPNNINGVAETQQRGVGSIAPRSRTNNIRMNKRSTT